MSELGYFVPCGFLTLEGASSSPSLHFTAEETWAQRDDASLHMQEACQRGNPDMNLEFHYSDSISFHHTTKPLLFPQQIV